MIGKLKKSSYFLLLVTIFLLILCSKSLIVHADEDHFKIDEVYDENHELVPENNIRQYEKDSSVYIIQGDNIYSDYLQIYATLEKQPDNIEVRDAIIPEKIFKYKKVSGKDNQIRIYGRFNTGGAHHLDVYLTYGEKVEKYTIIVQGTCSSNRCFDINLKDDTNNLIYGEEGWFTQNELIALKELKADKTTEKVSVKFLRDSEISETFNGNVVSLPWVSDGANQVRINGGEWKSVSGSGSSTGEVWSPSLPLKNGLNIVEIKSDYLEGQVNNREGFYRIDSNWSASYIFLIEWDGEPTKGIQSSDTDLSYLKAIQLGGTGVPAKSYGIGEDEDGNKFIALPEKLIVNNDVTYDKILFAALPSDSNAMVSVQEDVLVGSKAGIYQAVKVTDENGKVRDHFTVTVTAEDGTKKEYTIKLINASSDCSVNSLAFHGGKLLDINTNEATEYTAENKAYALSGVDKKLKFKCEIPETAVLRVNGTVVTADSNGYYECDANKLINTLEVTAADSINKTKVYLVTEKEDGSIPFFGQTKENLSLAQEMLDTGWNKRSDSEKKNMSTTYWDVYMAKASNVSFKNATVYDIDKHLEKKTKQATDWAACILESVIIGEDPYDYGENHINLVEELKACGTGGTYGPYANNHWAFMALKAAGEDMEKDHASLLKDMINLAYTVNDYKDTRAWAMAAVADYLTKDQIIELATSLNDARNSDGFWGNAFTDGCQFTAIAEMGINLDYYTVKQEDGTEVNVLQNFKSKKMTSDGKFDNQGLESSYVKDAIVGLGDIVNESSLWANLRLTNAKLKTLLTQSKEVLKQDNLDETAKAALQTAYDAAKACESDEYGFGPQYYALRKALINASEEYNDHIRVCSWEDSQNIDTAISATEAIGEVSISSEELLNKARTAYDSISTDKAKAYVTNYAVLTDAEAKYDKLFKEYIASLDEKIANLGDVDDLTIENQAAVKEVKELYDVLSDSQKKSLENGKTVQKAVNKMAALEVEALIEVIPEEVTLKNEKEIQAARKAYNELTTAQKRLVLSETYVKLTDAEKALKALKKPVVTIKLNKTSLTLKQNQKVTLKATVSSKEDVFWTSSNPKVASVDNSGVVTSYKDGTTVIKAFTKNGDKATCTVKVNAKLQLKANANKLTWKKIADAKGYKVYQYNSTSKKYKKIATLSASKTSYTVNKLNAGTNYTFKVTSYKVENGKDVTKKSEVVKTATKPAKVTINKVAKKSAKSIKITWKKTKATGYEVWMKSSKNGDYKLVKTITKSSTTSYTKSNLAKNKTYTFKIRAYKNVGDQTLYGAYSTAKSLKLK